MYPGAIFMKIAYAITLLSLLFMAGIIFFMHQESWIIFNFPTLPTLITNKPSNKVSYKPATLFIWHQNQFKQEQAQIMEHAHQTNAFIDLLNQFLSASLEKHLIDQPVQIESVISSTNGQDIFISFNHSPLNKEASTHHKLMFVYSLLQTIKHFDPNARQVQLLVHHQPLQDPHLSFDLLWSTQGLQIKA
jgi:hypothetical protein